jgi:hypothetical protein
MKLFAYILLLAGLTTQIVLADAPVIWNGTTAKWLPSGLRSAGVCRLDAQGVMTSGDASLTSDVSGILPLANGGTNKNMTAVNGGLVYSDADSQEVSAAGTAGQAAISGGAGAPTWYAPTVGSVLFAGTAGVLSEDNANLNWDDTNNNLNLAGASGNGGTLGSLNVKARSDSLGQHLQLEGPGTGGNRFLYVNQRENGDMFFYNPGLSRVLIDYNAAANSLAIGQTGGNFQFQVTATQPDTTPATPPALGSMAISNGDTTDGNYSGLLFQGSQSGLNPPFTEFTTTTTGPHRPVA